jgi:hypothetical protein
MITTSTSSDACPPGEEGLNLVTELNKLLDRQIKYYERT